jgi:FKBP-type peptidyl-prolyl cis-trans isomerase (trigger factor)
MTNANKPTKADAASKSTKENKTTDLIAANTIISLTIPLAEVTATYKKILQKLAKTTAAPGFREGKAPLDIAESVIGQSKLIEKTFQEVVPHAYYHAVTDKKYQPLTNPEFDPISIELTKDWVVEAHFAERPVVKLGDYTKTIKAALKAAQPELDKIKDDAEKTREAKLREIFKALVEANKLPIPELLLRQETRYELDDLIKNLDQLKLKIDDYLAKRQISTQELSNELATTALGKLQLEFILGAIAVDKKFTATEKDLDAALDEVKDPDTKAKLKADAQTMRQLEISLIRQKVIDHLLSL